MAAVLKPLMTGQPAPWLLYLAGVILAVLLEFMGVPPLAFALGLYLPLHLNTPLLVGGIVAHLVSKSSKNEKLNTARKERGTLLASGFIAGGALMGVIVAFISFFGREVFKLGSDWSLMKTLGTETWHTGQIRILGFLNAEILGFIMFALILIYLYWDAKRASAVE
jgi:hypothetical protein